MVNTSIRNKAAYDRGIWDWAILQGCFGNTLITPTDVDALVERKGKFLYIETKQPGAPIPEGQLITLRQLAKQGNKVLIVHGSEQKVENIQVLGILGEYHDEDPGLDSLRRHVKNWFDWADQQVEIAPAFKLARFLRECYGKDYCDTMMAEWVKLDEGR